MALPSAPFDTAKSILAGRTIVQLKIGAVSTVFESRLLNHKDDSEFKELTRPDAKGVLRIVRRDRIKGGESFTFEVDEAKRLLSDLFDGALSGAVNATASLWMPDPTDETGKVALASEADFDCTVERDGDLKFGDGDYTKAQIKITSNKQGSVTFTADATIPS